MNHDRKHYQMQKCYNYNDKGNLWAHNNRWTKTKRVVAQNPDIYTVYVYI